MKIKYQFCKAVKAIMDSVGEGKSVSEIVPEINVQDIPRLDDIGASKALLKLSEKVLQLKGLTVIVLEEMLKDLEDKNNQAVFAFIQIAEKISCDCSEVLSLIEADDLKDGHDNKRINAIKSFEEHALSLTVTDAQKEIKCGDLIVQAQDKTNALQICQEDVKIHPKVR